MKSRTTLALVGLFTLLAGACASGATTVSSAPSTARVTGTVTYRERIARLPGAVVHVVLEDVSLADAQATVIAQETIYSAGQVPVPFTLQLDPAAIDPRHRYAVRARITDAADRLRWVSTNHYPVLTYGNPREIEIVVRRVGAAPASTAVTFAFDCDGLDFTVQIQREIAHVFLPDRTVLLPGVPAASGAKYSDGSMTFWSKGNEALLDIEGSLYRNCSSNPARAVWEDAKLRGVSFRAVGNEPGWYLEIEDETGILLVMDYGQRRISTPVPVPEVERETARTVYQARTEAHELTVLLEGKPCRDTMSGEQFATMVTLMLDGRHYQGCGRTLQ
jgi:putative lipoprotein